MSIAKIEARTFTRRALLSALPVLAAIAAAATIHQSQAQPETAAPAPTEVTVAPVIHRPLHEWQEFTGRLQAVNTVEVRPRVAGYVDRVAFPDGARVKKGQLLFVIDPRPFQAETDRLKGELARAESDLDLARANQARAERLIVANAISREEYDRLGAGVSSARGQLDATTAALESARLNREFTEVRAPLDGRVSRALITAGNLVTSQSLLTTLVSDDAVHAYFDADERTYLRYAQLARSGEGDAARGVFMGLVDETGYPHEGRLDFVDNQVDPTTGTIRARAVFANPDGRYTPGLFARIRLVGGENRDTVLIEDRAVGTDLGRKFVLVLGPDNRLASRFIELGPQIDGLRVVREGLGADDVVVVNGLQHVKPGDVVAPTRVAMNEQAAGLRQVASVSPSTRIAASSVEGATLRSQR
ncbi:multidrug efflux system membrane fusion protein [Panacagrimonas perspica]|uniref:Multidrug efflux system membrane fusion protein n=1 Tax=Panacagrimonas perspica TaxID=381431 RepID=A0A4S3K4S2_9GAMM|nr:efflux RND transporter periplasmic adaptor subunit [Panacagrimonas perspica]TDU31814.1 multidrug efflux system membrane fusion protein [Panacagrimonas perspica]THD02978.1 efflux transporter periplasmic adaptor subunit [Panacagrimonas perspica]